MDGAPGVNQSDGAELGPERPLVTFALFAYNQERYIREAVEAAFAQTYEPLQIILSDDCSTDHTFEIMQEMAASYRGRHQIVVRQTANNKGLIGHINDVNYILDGDIIVMAAGDDISIAERVAEHVKIYDRWPKTFAVCSNYFCMTETFSSFFDQLQDRTCTNIREFTLLRHVANVGGWGLGATYSYRRQCLAWPATMPKHLESEDRILPTIAAILGRVAYHNGRLVRYRTPLEAGTLESKRRWMKERYQRATFNHIKSIIRFATSNRYLSRTKGILLIIILYIGFIRILTENDENWQRAKALKLSLIKLVYTPVRIALRLQRISDFYAPIINWTPNK